MALTVLVAPDSFKGSLSATDAADAMSMGWRSVRPEDSLILLPQADGGEGTLDAIESSVTHSRRRDAGNVTGPDGRPTRGQWLELADGTAVIELAQSSGLPLMHVPDATDATTRGLGEVIAAALRSGATSLVIGLGGSASTDAAAGALMALGLQLVDDRGAPIADGGRALARIAGIDRSALIVPGSVILLTDVTAPLLGPTGAAHTFAAQKGATPAQVAELEAAVGRFAALFGGDIAATGAGAAGGTAWGLTTAWGSTIVPGADYIAELSGLSTSIATADVLLTGEGCFDSQSLQGKVVGRLLDRTSGSAARVGIIAGRVMIETGQWTVSLSELAGSVESAMDDPTRWLRLAGAQAARDLGGVDL